jgi:hypothetical protein
MTCPPNPNQTHKDAMHIMSNEIKPMMPIEDALAWTRRWRNANFSKRLGTKDKVLITIMAEYETAVNCVLAYSLELEKARSHGGKMKHADEASPVQEPVRCLDCGALYRDFPLDVMVPNDQWKAMGFTGECGILCACCIVRRGANLPGVTVAKLRFE